LSRRERRIGVTNSQSSLQQAQHEVHGLVTNWLIATIAARKGDAVHLRVRLTPPHAGNTQALGQANLSLHGGPLRLQALGPTMEDAGLLLVERLARHPAHGADGFTPRPWPAPPTQIPESHGPLKVTRRKHVRLARSTAIEAARAMDDLDYDAHLFTDASTDQDAVIYRAGPTGYRLRRQRPAAPAERRSVPLVTDPGPAPLLALGGALQLLALTGKRTVFFTDLHSGRGALLYTRYAGGYGLIGPADE
jgi:hypothetical protein